MNWQSVFRQHFSWHHHHYCSNWLPSSTASRFFFFSRPWTHTAPPSGVFHRCRSRFWSAAYFVTRCSVAGCASWLLAASWLHLLPYLPLFQICRPCNTLSARGTLLVWRGDEQMGCESDKKKETRRAGILGAVKSIPGERSSAACA